MPTTYATPDLFPCGQCGRRFSRREHLERHRRIHTQEKPFTCTTCGRSYARRDVFARHLQLHGQPLGLPPAKRRNIRMACDSCHDRKVKCSTVEIPCDRCKRAGVSCTFSRSGTSSQDAALLPLQSAMTTDVGDNNNFVGLSSHSESMSSNSNDHTLNSPGNITMLELASLPTEIPNGNSMTANSSYLMDFPSIMDDNPFGLEPFPMTFDDDFSQLLPQVRENIYEDIAAACGSSSAEYNVSSWMGTIDSPSLIFDSLDFSPTEHRLNDDGQTQEGTFAHVAGAQHQRRVATAYEMLRQYSTTDQPSRPSSPKSVQAHKQYLQELGRISPVSCDKVIFNVFIGLYFVHVAPTLPCFKDQVLDSSTPEGMSLAMASIGGLYCEAPKSAVIARWLFHTAQRKLNTLLLHSETSNSPSQRRTIINCYILLDLFAFIYGDKRIFLLYEVFHGQVIQGFSTLNGECNDDEEAPQSAPQTKLIADTMYLMECYRVVLLQLPSRLYPTTLLGGVTANRQQNEDERQSLIRAMTTYDLPEVRITTPDVSIQALCSLALLASHGRQLPGSLMALLKSPTGVDPNHSSSAGWQQQYVELALQKWRLLHTTPPTASAQILFHLIHLNLYCSFAEIERTARASQKDKAEVSTDQGHTTHQPSSQHLEMDLDQCDSEPMAILQTCFGTTENLEKVTWHANRILDIASDMELGLVSRPNNAQIHLRQEASRAHNGEPIHFAHAVYHATMVLRLSSLLQKSCELGGRGGGSEPALDSIPRRGIRILSRSASRVAGVFKQVLESLQTTS